MTLIGIDDGILAVQVKTAHFRGRYATDGAGPEIGSFY